MDFGFRILCSFTFVISILISILNCQDGGNKTATVVVKPGETKGTNETSTKNNASEPIAVKPEKSADKNRSVRIVGAGLAGLAAAKYLRQCGFTDVKIYDLYDRIGGRVYSIPNPEVGSDGVLELGAEFSYYNGENGDDELDSLINTLNATQPKRARRKTKEILKSMDECGAVVDVVKDERFGKLLVNARNSVINTILGPRNPMKNDETVASLISSELKRQGAGWLTQDYVDDVIKIKKTQIESLLGAQNWNEISPETWYHFGNGVDVERYPTMGRQGFKPVIDFLTQEAGGLSNFLLDRTVKNIQYRNGPKVKFTVVENDKKATSTEETADFMIVTSSIGYMYDPKRLTSMFKEKVPDKKRSAALSLGQGFKVKIFLFYDKPFWGEDVRIMRFFKIRNSNQCTSSNPKANNNQNDETKLEQLFTFLRVHPHFDNILYANIGSNAKNIDFLESKAKSSTGLAEIKAAVTNVLRKFKIADEIPQPERVIMSNWYGDQKTVNSLTYMTKKCESNGNCIKNIAEPLYQEGSQNPKILFAGEATVQEGLGTAHGAYASGRLAANVLCNL